MQIRIILLSVFILALLAGTSCDPYAKIVKKGTIAEKDSAAVGYYQKKKWDKAVYLFDQLRSLYRGTPRARDIYYYIAYSRYHMGELVTASYYFEDFARQYPRDEKLEEMKYMHAYCYYLISDPWQLDQSFTYKALEKMQLFIENYPDSDKHEEANKIITELREKLAKKAFEQASLYMKIGHSKAAVEAFTTMIQKYPDSKRREEAQYLLFRSAHDLAGKSIQTKKLERYEEAIAHYEKFVDKFPSSKFVKDAEGIYENTRKNYQKAYQQRFGEDEDEDEG